MAVNFNEWLEKMLLKLNDETEAHNSPVIVATVIGKEVADSTKSDILNGYLGKEIFADKWSFEQTDPAEAKVKIDVYFDKTESVIWLLINGLHNVNLQYHVFVEDEQFKGKSFFEKFSAMESIQQQLLTFALLLSHVVLFMEPAARFDLNWVRVLEDINTKRLATINAIKDALASLPEGDKYLNELPISLQEEGRISLPKMLFCFCRNPLRSDLALSKKKELLEKMEKCLESQLSHILRQHGIIDNRSSDQALGQITISTGVPFVYIFNHNELPRDVHNEFVLSLYPEETTAVEEPCLDTQQLITDLLEITPKDKENLNRDDYNFDYFLHTALSNTHKEIVEDGVEPLTLSKFVRTAKFVWDLLKDEWANNAPPIQEMETLKSIIEHSIRSSMALYTNQLNLQPEITGGGDSVFSQTEHEYTLKMASEQLVRNCPRAVGKEKRNEMLEQLNSDCKTLWLDGHQRCPELSLTGQMCHYGIHELSDVAKTRFQVQQRGTRKRSHCSGVKTYSMCNCGLTRQIRIDPFSLKEANYEFYQKTDFTFGHCCAELEKYEFHLFDPRNVDISPLPSFANKGETSTDDNNMNMARKSPKLRLEQTDQNLEADEEDGFAIDPHEFNIRFFDDDEDEQISSEEGEEHEIKDETRRSEDKGKMVGGPISQDPGILEKEEFSDLENEEGGNEEEEEERRRKERIIESTEEEDEEGPDEETAEAIDGDSRPDSPRKPADYLDTYDQRRASTSSGRNNSGLARAEELVEKYRGHFLDHVPHSKSPPGLLPLFPSFSVVCIGHSSLYNHSTGIRESPNFRSGSEFLLPWNVPLTVKTEQWLRELQYIGATPTERTLRTLQQQQQRRNEPRSEVTSKEKVKLFIGFDYECPRGHRFMIAEPGKVLRHRRVAGQLKTDASTLMENDLPIWMPCPCKKEPRMSAQLMRIHIVTPKAPVSVLVQPLIQMSDEDDGYFLPGHEERIELNWAKYYVMRLPYVYVGPSGTPSHRPATPEFRGRLIRGCIQVQYSPILVQQSQLFA